MAAERPARENVLLTIDNGTITHIEAVIPERTRQTRPKRFLTLYLAAGLDRCPHPSFHVGD